MKVLMMTPTVDPLHSVQGFASTWISQIAQRVDKLYIITLAQRNVEQKNVIELYSLGTKTGRFLKFLYLSRLLLKLVPKVDVIFVHMYPLFPVLIWPWAKLFRKPIVFWYAHGHVSLTLRLAHALVNRIVTASEDSFRIKSRKVKVIGHGIDVERFPFRSDLRLKGGPTIITVGRISPVKDYETLVEATYLLVNEYGMKDLKFTVVGGPASKSERNYLMNIKALVRKRRMEEHFNFIGSVSYDKVAEFYNRADFFVSASQTGSIDKAVLEAIASGNLIITCNEAFFPFLGNYYSLLTFKKKNAQDLAKKIVHLHLMSEDSKVMIRSFLRKMVEAEHSLGVWLPRLISVFEEVLDER